MIYIPVFFSDSSVDSQVPGRPLRHCEGQHDPLHQIPRQLRGAKDEARRGGLGGLGGLQLHAAIPGEFHRPDFETVRSLGKWSIS